MPRLRRRLLNILTALSLLLFVGISAFWARSYFVHDIAIVRASHRQFVLGSEAGSVEINRHDHATDLGWAIEYEYEDVYFFDGESEAGNLKRFEFRLIDGPPRITWTLLFPHWTILGVLMVFLAGRFFQLRRRRRSTARGFPVNAAPPPT